MICLYCNKDKSPEDLSVEHGIPQFLGGKYATEIFKFRNVCKTCNSLLGRHVDASFARSWFVSAAIQNCAMVCYDQKKFYPIPLLCMGLSSFKPPGMQNDEVCESWLGPLSEQIFLIRKHDEAAYWLVGGDPVTPKKTQINRAYFFLSERSSLAPEISWYSFKYAYKDEKTKKIMCTDVSGADPKSIGFSTPDILDISRISYFKEQNAISSGELNNSLSFKLDFDYRFLCKLGMAVAYGTLGEDFLFSKYATELRNGIWYRPTSANDGYIPEIKGISTMATKDEKLEKILGTEGAVVIVLMQIPDGLAMQLIIGNKHFGCIKIADVQNIDPKLINIRGGYVLLLFKFLRLSLSMPIADYLSHKLGNTRHQELYDIENNIAKNAGFFKKLSITSQNL